MNHHAGAELASSCVVRRQQSHSSSGVYLSCQLTQPGFADEEPDRAQRPPQQQLQRFGPHLRPAADLISTAAFSAVPPPAAGWHQQQQQSRTAAVPLPVGQPGLARIAMQQPRFSTAAASSSDDPSSSTSISEPAVRHQQPGVAAAGHSEQPSGATAAGANAWWDDEGCFEYRAPLSTTVRRLKVGPEH